MPRPPPVTTTTLPVRSNIGSSRRRRCEVDDDVRLLSPGCRTGRGGSMAEFDEQAFRRRIRDYIAANVPDLPYRVGTRSPEDAHESTILRDWSAQLYARRVLRRRLAGRVRRARRLRGGRGAPRHRGARQGAGTDPDRCRAGSPPMPSSTSAPTRSRPSTSRRSAATSTCGASCSASPTPAATSPACAPSRSSDGDHFVVNGQKVWSTNAAFSDMGYLLARTDPSLAQARRHQRVRARHDAARHHRSAAAGR